VDGLTGACRLQFPGDVLYIDFSRLAKHRSRIPFHTSIFIILIVALFCTCVKGVVSSSCKIRRTGKVRSERSYATNLAGTRQGRSNQEQHTIGSLRTKA